MGGSMEFFKNLFTNDNSIIGLCSIESEKQDFDNCIDYLFSAYNYKPQVSVEYKNHEHLKNMFAR